MNKKIITSFINYVEKLNESLVKSPIDFRYTSEAQYAQADETKRLGLKDVGKKITLRLQFGEVSYKNIDEESNYYTFKALPTKPFGPIQRIKKDGSEDLVTYDFGVGDYPLFAVSGPGNLIDLTNINNNIVEDKFDVIRDFLITSYEGKNFKLKVINTYSDFIIYTIADHFITRKNDLYIYVNKLIKYFEKQELDYSDFIARLKALQKVRGSEKNLEDSEDIVYAVPQAIKKGKIKFDENYNVDEAFKDYFDDLLKNLTDKGYDIIFSNISHRGEGGRSWHDFGGAIDINIAYTEPISNTYVQLWKKKVTHGTVGKGTSDHLLHTNDPEEVVEIWKSHLKNAGYSDDDLDRAKNGKLFWNPPHNNSIDPIHFSVKNYVHNNDDLLKELKWYADFYKDQNSPQIKNKHSYTPVLKHAADNYGISDNDRKFTVVIDAIKNDSNFDETEEDDVKIQAQEVPEKQQQQENVNVLKILTNYIYEQCNIAKKQNKKFALTECKLRSITRYILLESRGGNIKQQLLSILEYYDFALQINLERRQKFDEQNFTYDASNEYVFGTNQDARVNPVRFLDPFNVSHFNLFNEVIIDKPTAIKKQFRNTENYDGNFAIFLDAANKIWFMAMNLIDNLWFITDEFDDNNAVLQAIFDTVVMQMFTTKDKLINFKNNYIKNQVIGGKIVSNYIEINGYTFFPKPGNKLEFPANLSVDKQSLKQLKNFLLNLEDAESFNSIVTQIINLALKANDDVNLSAQTAASAETAQEILDAMGEFNFSELGIAMKSSIVDNLSDKIFNEDSQSDFTFFSVIKKLAEMGIELTGEILDKIKERIKNASQQELTKILADDALPEQVRSLAKERLQEILEAQESTENP